jgi:hypothetical protein
MAIDKCYILMYFCVFPRLYTITFLRSLLSLSEGEFHHQLEGRRTGYLQLFAWFNQETLGPVKLVRVFVETVVVVEHDCRRHGQLFE